MRSRLLLVAAALTAVAAVLLPADATPSAGALTAPVLRVWPLGDSITFGYSSPQNSPGGYRTALDQLLTRSGTDHRFVGMTSENSSPTLDVNGQGRHDGHCGYRIDQVRADLDGLSRGPSDYGGRWLTRAGAAAALYPDVVLIHLGTNDIMQRWDTRRYRTRDGHVNFNVAAQRRMFVADLTARLGGLLLRIHTLRPRTMIVVATIIPIDIAGYAAAAADYAASIRTMVQRLAAQRLPLALADVYSAFLSGAPPGANVAPGLLSNDAVHPTTAGYAVIARTFAAVLQGRTLPVSAHRGERP